MKRFFVLLAIMLNMSGTAFADDSDIVARWYGGLQSGDRDVFTAIMANEARVIFKETQQVQTREAFLDALGETQETLKDARIDYSLDRMGTERLVAQVCYDMPSGSFMNREIFTIIGGKITYQVQEKLRDGCGG